MQLSRRRFLALSATMTAAACAGDDAADDTVPSTTPAATDPPRTTAAASTTASTTSTTSTTTTTTEPETEPPAVELAGDPFVYGVASGDPNDSSVVLWTRLGGELPDDELKVRWRFTPDDGSPAIEGSTTTSTAIGGSVHMLLNVDGPGSFGFSAGGWDSPLGRTAPIDPAATEFRLAAASCQNYEAGFYAAHRDIAEWKPDLVVFLGDFIYEGFNAEVQPGVVRLHEPFEPVDLDGYRARYGQYLLDPQLQAARAAAPWLSIWDDHEVDNNYAGLISEDGADPASFVVRRAQAYQAWWENTPTRLPPPRLSDDPANSYTINRGVDVGDLLSVSAVDGRQFRDDQLSDVILDTGPPVAGWDDPERTMLGAAQEAWLGARFAESSATWNCLAQQTVFGDTRLGEAGAILNYDQWDGYHAARNRLLAVAPSNFIAITGDIHLAGVGEIKDADETLGIEFVSTAISSAANVDPALVDVVKSIPAIVDAELEFRGYARHMVTPEAWTAEYRQVVDITDADSEVRTWKSFQVQSGTSQVDEI